MFENKYWLAFAVTPGIGPMRFHRLLRLFTSAENAWNASENELLDSGIGKEIVMQMIHFRKNFDPDQYEQTLLKKKIKYITMIDGYPPLLKNINRAPFVLFLKGNAAILKDLPCIAIVGTRSATDYGRQTTRAFAHALVQSQCVIVSGLAMGIDAIAHQTTLESGGKTIAVLGSGVDLCTPRENQSLYNRIIDSGGCIVSELPPGTFPNKGSFPARNRIIAGLSQAVLVTEGSLDSGSLITAEFALTFGRPVFTIPGPITSQVSQGPFALYKKGAIFVSHPNDLLDSLSLNSASVHTKKRTVSDKNMQQIINILLLRNETIDGLVKATKLSYSLVASSVSLMEIQGIVEHAGNGEICLKQ